MLGVARDELKKSYRKKAFVEAAQRLVSGVHESDFRRSYAGIRAQLISDDGKLIDEPIFEHGPDSLHVLNAVNIPLQYWIGPRRGAGRQMTSSR